MTGSQKSFLCIFVSQHWSAHPHTTFISFMQYCIIEWPLIEPSSDSRWSSYEIIYIIYTRTVARLEFYRQSQGHCRVAKRKNLQTYLNIIAPSTVNLAKKYKNYDSIVNHSQALCNKSINVMFPCSQSMWDKSDCHRRNGTG